MGKRPSSFAPQAGGVGGVAAALPTRAFVGNGARFVLAEQVAPRYTDRRFGRVLVRPSLRAYSSIDTTRTASP